MCVWGGGYQYDYVIHDRNAWLNENNLWQEGKYISESWNYIYFCRNIEKLILITYVDIN